MYVYVYVVVLSARTTTHHLGTNNPSYSACVLFNVRGVSFTDRLMHCHILSFRFESRDRLCVYHSRWVCGKSLSFHSSQLLVLVGKDNTCWNRMYTLCMSTSLKAQVESLRGSGGRGKEKRKHVLCVWMYSISPCVFCAWRGCLCV